MKTLKNIAIAIPVLFALAHTTSGIAQPKTAPKLPNGKPFQYLNSRIDALQSQINTLIGRVDSLETWQMKAQAALAKLEQSATDNAAAIALLQSEIDNINQILQTKQDILKESCPANQSVYQILSAPAGLVCRPDAGANGLSVYTVDVAQDIAVTSNATLTATCPTGTVATGGSFNLAPGLTMTSAGLVDNGYAVTLANTTDSVLSATVTGTCLGIAK